MKKIIIAFLMLNCLSAQNKEQEYKWVSAQEIYFIFPIVQNPYLPDIKNEKDVSECGMGIMGTGSKTFSKTGGLQM